MKINEGIVGLIFKSFRTRTTAKQSGDIITFEIDLLTSKIKIDIKRDTFLNLKEWINSLDIK